MLHFSRLSKWSIVAALVAAIVVVLPNFFPRATVDSWPSWMPKNQLVLGLDLRGGSYLLYEVDTDQYIARRLDELATEVRNALAEEPRIVHTLFRAQIAQTQAVQVRIEDPTRIDEARTRLEALRSPLSTSLLGGGSNFEFQVAADGNLLRMSYTDAGLAERVRLIIQQSIEVIGRRINELGTTESSIQRQGDNRILVEAPGLEDPQRLKELVGQTAQLTFHMVQPPTTDAGADAIRLPSVQDPSLFYNLDREPLIRGEQLVDANAAFDSQTGAPVVNFRFNTTGARIFAEVTQQNVNRQFAIVLDDQIISAPRINEPILGGSGQISGGFTVEEANNLAILLRAGALPARLQIVEERSIGPGLGADSIRAGEIAAVVGTIAVGIFMVAIYGFFGLIANVAVLMNLVIIFAVMNLLGATLTLPGIAGIVLTVGTAVDANVLIYERIREEFKTGRSAIQAIDVGFQRALATILDANITTLIAAVVLFQFGSGPIRGFAVTLAIGIATTLFTAFLVTRLMVAIWVRRRRPVTINL